jgi:hypothetical protein
MPLPTDRPHPPAQQAAGQVQPWADMQGDLSAFRERMHVLYLQRRLRDPCPSGPAFVAEARAADSGAPRAGGLLQVQHQPRSQAIASPAGNG